MCFSCNDDLLLCKEQSDLEIKILCYGITRDLLGGFEQVIELQEKATVRDLKNSLIKKYPMLEQLASLRIAVDQEYAEEDLVLQSNNEIVLIPPVSGG